jgi:choline dehydrogenase
VSAYDYVIAGAGSAGCVLAARLSEDPAVRVLLLEAGPRDRSWKVRMPAGVGRLISETKFNWAYRGEPEPFLDNRVLTHPRGRVLGGSSSINGMVYVRGHARDYDGWAQAGLRGWSYADVLPYFKRAEQRAAGADEWRGGSGPLHVTAPDFEASPLARAFIAAGLEAGYPHTPDVNGRQQEGFGPIERTTRNGRRWSAADAYLRPALGRPNLTVLTSAHVEKLVVSKDRVTGLRYRHGGQTIAVEAARAAILCGGAFNSPHLLQLSGIGAAAQLEAAGIKVTHDLPGVGQNLNDHPDIVLQFRSRLPVSLYSVSRGPRSWLAGMRWFVNGTGPAASNHFEAGAFIRSRAGVEHPDLQLTFMPLAVVPGSVNIHPGHAFQVHVDLMRPRSRGYVRARSGDPYEAPAILFNYLRHPGDRDDFRASVRLVREIIAMPAMRTFAGEAIFPAADVMSDDAIDAFVRRAVETCYHPVGTCKMGHDPLAVVDGELRVHGLEGLRVVDASIMPSIVSGNTNAPTIMIAEKAADLILGRKPPPPSSAAVWVNPNWERAQR